MTTGPLTTGPGTTGPGTLVGVWAHYDDDLLFANPAIDLALADGCRVRSLFLTASDAGQGMSEYAAEREVGIRAAYDVMRQATGVWTERAVTLPNGVTLTVTEPEGDPRVSLAFLRLPDGGLSGGGWFPTGYETLPKLLRGEISAISTLDTRQKLTAGLLVRTIADFVSAAEATAVVANLPGFADGAEGDHPDHASGGRLVAAAVDGGLVDGAVVRYAVGYPGADRPANVGADDLARKLDAFAAYAGHDHVIARDDPRDYLAVRGFGEWVQRQYLVAHRDLDRVGADDVRSD